MSVHFRFAFGLVLLLLWRAGLAQGIASVPDGPNHFIVLVDSSKSMSRAGAKRTAAASARIRLAKALFGSQRLPNLPPYRADRDLLSVHDFGIDTSATSTGAYKRIRYLSLQHDYLCPHFVARTHASANDLSIALEPKRETNLGILAWARTLGLWASRLPPITNVQSTYVILVTDSETNAGSASEEADIMERFASANDRKWIHEIRSNVAKHFRFVDADGVDSTLFEERLGSSKPVYLVGYLVGTIQRQRNDMAAARIRAFEDARGRWPWEVGKHPTGAAVLDLSDELKRWVGNTDGVRLIGQATVGQLHGTATSAWRDSLQVPIRFDGLPWQSSVGRAALTVERTDADPWLGSQRVRTRFETVFVLPTPLSRTVGHLLPSFLMGLAAAGLLAGGMWLLGERRNGRHFGIKLPGFANSIRLAPIGAGDSLVPVDAPITPESSREALRVKLPHRLLRSLLYKDAVLELSATGSRASWVGHDESVVPVSAFGRDAVAQWVETPSGTGSVSVAVQRGNERTSLQVRYPEAAPVTTARKKMAKYYVALDLGSDSMAACYDIDGEPKMVPLQHFARYTMSGRPDYLTETAPNGSRVVSTRLRSQISLRNNQPESSLPPAHMSLDFFDQNGPAPTPSHYDSSIFAFFHPENVPPDVNAVLPNPKVMFQYGVENAFPNAITTQSPPTRMQLTPEIVIQHLTVQVLRNFVLRWGPLERIYEQEPEEIEVVLTIPNVYSVEHSETLRQNVASALGIGEVSVISESDAVAYYRRACLPATLREAEPAYANALPAPATTVHADASSSSEPTMQLLTVDVGRGTTDLSLVRVDNENGAERVTIRARTGRSSGGGELTYLFARFFERQIERAFAEMAAEVRAQLVPGFINIPWPDSPPISFLWLKAPRYRSQPEFLNGLQAMVQLIEEVKRAYGAYDEFTTPDSAKPHIDRIADSLVAIVRLEQEPSWVEQHGAELEALRLKIVQRLTVNKVLTAGLRTATAIVRAESDGLSATLLAAWRKFMATLKGRPVDVPVAASAQAGKSEAPRTQDDDLLWLGGEIERYVKLNVDDLIVELAYMAGNRDDQAALRTQDTRRRLDTAISCLAENDNLYVVVGGQASQFRPIRERLQRIFERRTRGGRVRDYWHIPGSEAKEACCKGAVIFKRAGDVVANGDHLHGSYAFVDYARGSGPGAFELSTYDLNHRGYTHVDTDRDTGRYLVYSPGMLGGTIDDTQVSRIGANFHGRSYDVYYEPHADSGCRRLRVGDTSWIQLQTYGGLKSVIWHKVWPDQLPEEEPR